MGKFMRITGPLLFLLAALSVPGAARGLVTTRGDSYQCVVNLGTPPDSPRDMPPGAQVSTCKDPRENIHYVLRTPRPNRDGVCRVYEEEIFPGAPSDSATIRTDYGTQSRLLKGWTSRPPQAWRGDGYRPMQAGFALLADGECPAVSDPAYVRVTNVSDGMMKAFHQAWSKAISSHQAFDKMFSGLVMKTDFSQRYLSGVRDSVLRGTARPQDMRCDDNGCAAWVGMDVVDFDLVDGRFAFTSLYHAPVP
jgi:hypothetical protein